MFPEHTSTLYIRGSLYTSLERESRGGRAINRKSAENSRMGGGQWPMRFEQIA